MKPQTIKLIKKQTLLKSLKKFFPSHMVSLAGFNIGKSTRIKKKIKVTHQ